MSSSISEKVTLIPDEGFVEDSNSDKSKSFACKQCDKSFKSKQAVKQHIANVHKNEALKRTANKSDNHGKKNNRKQMREDDRTDDGPLHSTQLNATQEVSMNVDEYVFEKEIFNGFGDVFKFNATVEEFLARRRAASDACLDDTDDLEEMSPDQDHNFEAANDEEKADLEDIDLLRAKNVSLKIGIENRDVMLNEKENELKSLQLELSEVTNEAYNLKKEVKDKDEALDTATAHINSLEENKKMLESKLIEYTTSLRSIIKEQGAKKRKESDSDDTAKETELKGIIKEKNKALKSSETAQKVLANKLAEIENKVNTDKSDMDSKYKKVNDQLSDKLKEVKKTNGELKKAEKKAKDMMDIVSDKNRKISELENSNSRLRLMKDQAKEIADKKSVTPPPSSAPVKKCKFENTGNCRNGNKCPEAHPKNTCQSFSKLGSCPLESQCEHRHPYGICYDWQNHGACFKGDICRNRHPIEMAAHRTQNPEHFLGHGSPSGANRVPVERKSKPSQRSPEQPRHRDQRGSRW